MRAVGVKRVEPVEIAVAIASALRGRKVAASGVDKFTIPGT